MTDISRVQDEPCPLAERDKRVRRKIEVRWHGTRNDDTPGLSTQASYGYDGGFLPMYVSRLTYCTYRESMLRISLKPADVPIYRTLDAGYLKKRLNH